VRAEPGGSSNGALAVSPAIRSQSAPRKASDINHSHIGKPKLVLKSTSFSSRRCLPPQVRRSRKKVNAVAIQRAMPRNADVQIIHRATPNHNPSV